MYKNLGPQIIALSNQGKNYDEIKDILHCSKGTISYHLGTGQKNKNKIRTTKYRNKYHPYKHKLESFIYRNYINPTIKIRNLQSIRRKLLHFFRYKKTKMTTKPSFTEQDIINKFGENPSCYLTGTKINIYDTKSYSFDHKIPISRGGQSTLDNLGITTKQVNRVKSDLTPEELIELSKQILINNGYIITKSAHLESN